MPAEARTLDSNRFQMVAMKPASRQQYFNDVSEIGRQQYANFHGADSSNAEKRRPCQAGTAVARECDTEQAEAISGDSACRTIEGHKRFRNWVTASLIQHATANLSTLDRLLGNP